MDMIKVILLVLTMGLSPAVAKYHKKSIAWEAFKATPTLPPDAVYGYSILTFPESKRVIVSAPKADIVGKVFSCDVTSPNTPCDYVDGTSDIPSLIVDPNKNDTPNYWFGANIVAAGSNFVTCAPRYWTTWTLHPHEKEKGQFSRCFMHSDNILTEMKHFKYTPVSKDKVKIQYDFRNSEGAMDSFGWSSDTSEQLLLVGGPAMFLKAGGVLVYTDTSQEPRAIKSPTAIRFNFGYSLASGNYYADSPDGEVPKRNSMHAFGSTYGIEGEGKVIFMDESQFYLDKPKVYELVSPTEAGSNFGACLLSAKLNHDDWTDLLVGAPLYSPQDSTTDFDVGAVYVYVYDAAEKKLKQTCKLLGKQSEGRFGSTIISIGDMDNDQLEEIVVAAPYADNRGSIYLYSGSDLSKISDSQPEPKQIIQSERDSFGLSMAKVNINTWKHELIVGAPQKNSLALLKYILPQNVSIFAKFPDVDTTLVGMERWKEYKFDSCVDFNFAHNIIASKKLEIYGFETTWYTEGHINIHLMNLLRYLCTIPCTFVHLKPWICSYINELDCTYNACDPELRVKITILNVANIIMEDSSDGTYTYEVTIGDVLGEKIKCEKIKFSTTSAEKDYLRVVYKMEAYQVDSPEDSDSYDFNTAIIKFLGDPATEHSQWIVKKCANVVNCNFKLKTSLESTPKTTLILGNLIALSVTVKVSNIGEEPAYTACVLLGTGIDTNVRLTEDNINCHKSNIYPDYPLECKIDYVDNKATWSTGVIPLDTSSLTSNDREITIKALTRDDCNKAGNGFNPETLKIYLEYQYDAVTLQGYPNPKEVVPINEYEMNREEKIFSHIYTIKNPSTGTNWAKLTCSIALETQTYLKYSMVMIKETGKEELLECQSKVNEKNIATCKVGSLKPNGEIKIHITVTVLPGKLSKEELKKNITFESEVSIFEDRHIINFKVKSILTYAERPQVPLLILIAAVGLGLCVVALICFIMYKQGFFQRKIKDKLMVEKRKTRSRRLTILESSESGDFTRTNNFKSVFDELHINSPTSETEETSTSAQINEREY